MNDPQRTILVTGSASGMGAAISRRLGRSGARVVGVDRGDSDIVGDLGTPEGRQWAVNAALDMTDSRLDGVVACAGIGPQATSGAEIVRVNYFGALATLDGLRPALERGEAPAAVAIASNAASLTPRHDELLEKLTSDDEEGAAKLADTVDGVTAYGMSKLALVRAMRRRARSWGAAGVRLNAVAPGPIRTPMLEAILAKPKLRPVIEALPIPLDRQGEPDEVAAVVEFLLGPESAYVQGSLLFVDGGSDALLRPDGL